MKKKIILITLITVLSTLAIAGGVIFAINKNRSQKAPSEIQDKNSNTYQQNATLYDGSNPGSSNEKSATAVNTKENAHAAKPVLTKSASTAPAGVPIDFTCTGTQGADCQVKLKNVTSGQMIILEKKKITTDKLGQNNAYWIWQTLTGSWQVTATAITGSAESMSDPQMVEVKK